MSKRTRWAGLHLGDGKRDRVIAEWLDSVGGLDPINVSEIVKDHLYKIATGQVDQNARAIQNIQANLEELKQMIRAGAVITGTDGKSATEDDIDEIARRLGSMQD